MGARAIAICLLVPALAAAAAVADPLEATIMAQLETGITLARAVPPGGSPAWLPQSSVRQSLQEELARVGPTILVEAARVFPGATFDSPEGRLRIYNALHAVSTLKGIPYWSVTSGAERVLFTSSYVIGGPKDTARRPDPVFTSIPKTDVLYSLQVDTAFGRHVYRITYTDGGDCLEARIQTADAISWLFVPMVAPGNLVTLAVLVPTPGGLLFCGLSWLKTGMPIGGREGREASLLNRLLAMADWLEARVGPPR